MTEALTIHGVTYDGKRSQTPVGGRQLPRTVMFHIGQTLTIYQTVNPQTKDASVSVMGSDGNALHSRRRCRLTPVRSSIHDAQILTVDSAITAHSVQGSIVDSNAFDPWPCYNLPIRGTVNVHGGPQLFHNVAIPTDAVHVTTIDGKL